MSLLGLLPPHYHHSPEVSEFQTAVGVEVEKAQTAAADLLLQLNVDTATWGLGLWEDAYGIPRDVTKPYDFRRSQIKSKRRSAGTTTVSMIKNVAESFSNGEVEVTEHNSEYRFDVKFVGVHGIPPSIADLSAAIDEIKPAHLAYAYIYTYITWSDVELYNHTWAGWDAMGLMWDAFEKYRE